MLGKMVIAAITISGLAAASDPVPNATQDATSTVVAAAVPSGAEQKSVAAPEAKKPEPPANDASAADELRDKWGIEIVRIMLSAAGYMVDFRYRVVDPQKATALTDSKVNPYIIDQATGAKFGVPNTPKAGSLRSHGKEVKKERVCFALFANPSQYLKKDSKLTVVFGDCRIQNLALQ